MTRRFQYFAGFVWVMPTIWLLSFLLTLDLAGWEDSPAYLSVPLLLRIAYSIVFPMSYLLPTDTSSSPLIWSVFVGNGILWAFLFVFSCRFIAHIFRAKKSCSHDAA